MVSKPRKTSKYVRDLCPLFSIIQIRWHSLSLFPFVSCRWLWQRIVSTYWIPLCCGPVVLIARSNSHHQTRRPVSTFSKSTPERWIWHVASTYERLPSSCPALPERKSRFISTTLWLVFSSLLTFQTHLFFFFFFSCVALFICQVE